MINCVDIFQVTAADFRSAARLCVHQYIFITIVKGFPRSRGRVSKSFLTTVCHIPPQSGASLRTFRCWISSSLGSYKQRVSLYSAAISDRCKFEDSVKRDAEIWKFSWAMIQEVRHETLQDSLVTNDQDIGLSFQFHNHRFQSSTHITVRLSPGVSVIERVFF